MACNWLMVTSSSDNNWPKELRNGLQLADDDIIRGGLDIVTDKKNNKPKAEQETAQPTAARFNYRSLRGYKST